MIFEGGGVRTPCSPSGSAHALHPPMSKSRANVLLIFQCPGICLTPSQVDILVSDDSHAFCPTMYNRVFTWVKTRAKSELRVRLVPLNMLKLSSFSLLAQISSIVVLNVKNLTLNPVLCVCVCVCVSWWWWWWGDQDVITIRTSIMTPLSATGSRVSTAHGDGGGGGQWLQMHFTLSTRVGICVRYITMEMSTDVKNVTQKNTLKK